MKKMIGLIVALTLVFTFSATAFAAPEETSDTRPSVDGESSDRPHSIDDLFATYYPEGAAAHAELVAEHESFHASRASVKEEHQASIEAQKADMRAAFQAIRADLEAGTITEEEAQVAIGVLRSEIEAKRSEMEAMRAQLDLILAEKQAANEALKSQRQANRATIKSALQSDPIDANAIASALASGLDLLRQHIDLDYYYADQIDAVLDSSF